MLNDIDVLDNDMTGVAVFGDLNEIIYNKLIKAVKGRCVFGVEREDFK
jgi:hypothetical protein